MSEEYAIKILNENDDTVTIGGYGIIFGGRDLAGDTFTVKTDFNLDVVPNVPTYYDHAQNVLKDRIGTSVVKTIDKVGVFFETELAKSNQYIKQILKLIDTGVLGYSTGAVSHLVDREGGEIKNWPMYEISLTATPAEPRTIGVEHIKASVEVDATQASVENATKTKGDLPMSEKQEGQEVEDFGAEMKTLRDELNELKAIKMNPVAPFVEGAKEGKEELKAFMDYARNGGNGKFELKALNITTATEGGETVPVGFYDKVIERIEESDPLHSSLGARMIPGKGTTVQVPVEDSASGLMTASTESAAETDYEPTFSQVDVTYVTYRGVVAVTSELLRDEDVALESFLVNRFARMATNTMNNALITEVETNGSLLTTFASATAIVAGEIEDIAMGDAIAPYVESGQSHWVMRESTKGAVQSITGDRFYVDSNGADAVGQSILVGYPVQRSSYADAMTSALKPVLFGNFDYVGFRMADGIEILRDPFSRAANGEILFHVSLSYAVKVLQADAVGYGQQAV